MQQLSERKGFKIESTLPQKKKKKETKAKPVEHVRIIDDDVLIPYAATQQPLVIVNDEIVSIEDDPVVVGIVDDRPKEVRDKERFKDLKRWRAGAFEEVPDAASMAPKPAKSSSSSSRRHQNSSDDSDPDLDRGQRGRDKDPDLSPPRRRTQQKNDDPSPPRRKPQARDDSSPPRHRDRSSSRSQQRDSSPPRRNRNKPDEDPSPPRRQTNSPVRKRYIKPDVDASPPRRRDTTSPSHRRTDRHSRQESPPSSTHHRRPKQEPMSPPSNTRRPKQGSSSPPAAFQPAQSERRRLAEHKEKVAERYAKWGRGVAQVQQVENTVKDYLQEAAKPFARHRDDTDLEAMLKQREREDDPMLKYLSNQSTEKGAKSGSSVPAKPRYKGPDPQKNRFDIWPGYRWDGVDRSNGHEKKLFESIAHRHNVAQEAHMWSVEDM